MRFAIIALLCAIATVVSAETIPFDSDQWVGLSGQVEEFEGKLCRTGSAYLPNIGFENGVIEYLVWLDGSKGYPGVTFHVAGPGSYEHVYLRPHAGLRSDGLQYAPAFGPGSDWQLYHGTGYTASVEMPAGRWLPVRIEVLGKRARVFIGERGEGDEPDLVIDDLKHEPIAAPVGIRSAADNSARFADFRVTRTDDLTFPPPAPRPRPARGLVTEWELSRAFELADVDMAAYPNRALLDQAGWQTVPTEKYGLLNIARHAQRSTRGQGNVAFVRATLHANEAGLHPYTFGYSDYLTVCLDGVPLYTGDNSYRSRSEDFAGVIALGDQLHLPLKQGDNELLLMVAETFGGWGVMAQDNEADFLAAGLTELWSHGAGNRLPESVVYDSQRDVLYVSQYFRGGGEYLSRVAPDGTILEREWITGLRRPTGLVLDGDRLWVVQRTGLAEIDVAEGRILVQYPVAGAAFPNDAALGPAGELYVTDTAGGRIWRVENGQATVWLEGPEVGQPNGICWHEGKLLYGTAGDGLVRRVDPATREITTLCELGAGLNVDGICPDGGGGLIVSGFEGRVVRRAADGAMTLLMDLSSSGGRTADLTYVPQKKLLVVPGLYDNQLTGYRYDPVP